MHHQTTKKKTLTSTSAQFSSSVVSDSLRPHGLQHTRLPCTLPTPRVYSFSVIPFSSTVNLSQHQGLLQWVNSSHQVAKVLEFQLQHQSFQWIFRTDFLQDGLVGSAGSPKDSQESFPTAQFKSINSLALSFLYRYRIDKKNWTSLIAQMVKNLPTIQEIQVLSLVQEDPLE